MLFRLIFWTIIIYFIFKFISRIIKAVLLQNSRPERRSNDYHSSGGVNSNQQSQARNHYNIDKKDIVEAEFEEIKPEEEEKKPEDKQDKNK